MLTVLFWIAIWFALFLVTAWCFAIYVAVRPKWTKLHWSTKIVYGVPVLIGYVADWFAGLALKIVWYREVPDLTAATISQVTQSHFWDSKVALFIFSQILIIDPTHLGGIPKKPQ